MTPRAAILTALLFAGCPAPPGSTEGGLGVPPRTGGPRDSQDLIGLGQDADLRQGFGQQAQATLRGIAQPLYSADPGYDYGPALREIAGTGANAVSLPFALLQDNAASTTIEARPGRTPPDETIRRTMRQARDAGLEPMLFPLVLLDDDAPADDWRGSLRPEPVAAWFDSYRARIVHYARIAQEEECAWFCIGGEFSSLEHHTTEWRRTIAAVREVFTGKLVYSANWDHFDGPREWWSEVDAMGLSSYFELTRDKDAPEAELAAAWARLREKILIDKRTIAPDLPLLLTEVGYASTDGAAMYPWDYTLEGEADAEEQRRCYAAFIAAWDGRPEVLGVFFYDWIGFAPDPAKAYTPRGKPAEGLIREWYGGTKPIRP